MENNGRGIEELLDDQRPGLFSLFFNNFFGFGNFSNGEVEHVEDEEGEGDEAGDRGKGVWGLWYGDIGVRGVTFLAWFDRNGRRINNGK